MSPAGVESIVVTTGREEQRLTSANSALRCLCLARVGNNAGRIEGLSPDFQLAMLDGDNPLAQLDSLTWNG